MNDVLIIDTGVANLRSMEAALEREDFPTRRTRDAEAIATAERVVLPGVGSFARGLDNLGTDCAAALKKRVTGGLPTLAVCLGMQMLAECSEEDPGRRGLGLLPGAVQRLTAGRIPHLGWNRVSSRGDDAWLPTGFAAFAHSFALPAEAAADLEAQGWSTAVCTSGDAAFVAAAGRDGVLACQFHPELSGAWGRDLLRRWLRAGKETPCL